MAMFFLLLSAIKKCRAGANFSFGFIYVAYYGKRNRVVSAGDFSIILMILSQKGNVHAIQEIIEIMEV